MNDDVFIKEYMNLAALHEDIENFKDKQFTEGNMYIFAKDTNTPRNLNDINGVDKYIQEEGDQPQNALQNLGFSSDEADYYSSKLDDGKALLVIKHYKQGANPPFI
ncbi:general stress protein [Aneurinibacillus sp. Ricciae_BoGa-3]|uniref:general stress protein n=1 Tax=Aneurinibacillus sp. Ricciae_BoGa-3 TaxID=3022697 RepID=UPI0023423473|nr:general stress protein [Aneurinibacillus sp. Ricciae_BoGa-3]WCK56228.1 general stress protein [Aneurinibacillus sp. Ricciae_BoGa-3]